MSQFKNITISILLGILLTGSAFASKETADRFNLDLQMDKEGNFNPDTFIPLYWNKNWFSGVGFKDSTQLTQTSLDNFTDSKLGTTVSERAFILNLISYQSNNDGFAYSVGGDYQLTSIDKAEFGYFYLNNGVIDDFIAFDNTIEIEISGFSLRGDLTWGKVADQNIYRLSVIFSPANALSVDQNTDFKPIVSSSGTGSSSKSQALNNLLQYESRHRLNNFFSVGLDLQYEVLPLEYDLQVLAATADSFQDTTVDTTETATRIGLRFIFNHELVKDLYPVLGVTSESIEVKNNSNGDTTNTSQTLISLGFTGRF